MCYCPYPYPRLTGLHAFLPFRPSYLLLVLVLVFPVVHGKSVIYGQ